MTEYRDSYTSKQALSVEPQIATAVLISTALFTLQANSLFSQLRTNPSALKAETCWLIAPRQPLKADS